MRARPKKPSGYVRIAHYDMHRIYPASDRQKELVQEIADKLGIEPPEKLNRDTCRQFINNHIRRLVPENKRGGWV